MKKFVVLALVLVHPALFPFVCADPVLRYRRSEKGKERRARRAEEFAALQEENGGEIKGMTESHKLKKNSR